MGNRCGIKHMLSYQDQQFENFESLIASWEKAYRFADIAYVGIKTKEGLRLLLGRIILQPFYEKKNKVSFQCKTEHVIAEHFVLDIASLGFKSLLDKTRKGELPTAKGLTIPLTIEGQPSVYFSPIRHPFVADGIRLPNLRISGIEIHNLIIGADNHLDIDWELKSANEPFNDFDELLRQCGLPAQREMGSSTSIEIIAPTPAIISDASVIENNEIKIECRIASSLATAKVRLGYKVFQGAVIGHRESIEGAKLKWKKDNNSKIGICRLKIEDASLVQAFISYAGVALHQWWITDPNKRLNPRHAIHQIFDDDLELLKKMLLKPEVDKPYAFEHAVSMLMNLLGYSVSNYGRIPKLQKGPDVIAISPAGNIAVVECTVGLIDENDKLAKLVQRAKLIQDKLNSAGYGYMQLQRVVVTPLSRSEIAANLDVAGKYDIAVICKEDIEGMISQVSLPLNPEKLFEDAKRLVPNMAQGLFGRG
jgi:hypothetical protein